VDFVREFSARTELAVTRVVGWLGIARGKFFDWRQRYGKANEHNALVPRDHWLEEAERQAIVEYFDRHPLEGYRRLTFMMLDEDVVAVSCHGRWGRMASSSVREGTWKWLPQRTIWIFFPARSRGRAAAGRCPPRSEAAGRWSPAPGEGLRPRAATEGRGYSPSSGAPCTSRGWR
jgi:hypothetical protein